MRGLLLRFTLLPAKAGNKGIDDLGIHGDYVQGIREWGYMGGYKGIDYMGIEGDSIPLFPAKPQ